MEIAVGEPSLNLMHCLDGQENVAFAGKTTLVDLYGEHNVTAYARDEAGNVGTSETVTFTITKPDTFPTPLSVAMAILVSFVAISAGLQFYFRQRRHRGLS